MHSGIKLFSRDPNIVQTFLDVDDQAEVRHLVLQPQLNMENAFRLFSFFILSIL
jgi:hypothetical protein